MCRARSYTRWFSCILGTCWRLQVSVQQSSSYRHMLHARRTRAKQRGLPDPAYTADHGFAWRWNSCPALFQPSLRFLVVRMSHNWCRRGTGGRGQGWWRVTCFELWRWTRWYFASFYTFRLHQSPALHHTTSTLADANSKFGWVRG